MKKIIEAAEQVCELRLKFNSDTLSRNLCDAIAERKRLEQTPITEEWLQEHGWKIKSNYYGRPIYSSTGARYCIECFFGRRAGDGCCLDIDEILPNGVNKVHKVYATLADLYDACELCGIELDK